MKNIKTLYIQHCIDNGVEYQHENLSVKSYNDSTLFCPAGIQQFNHLIKTDYKGTHSNIQPCIRLNDLNEIGDGSHLLYFNMIGLFSFRQLSLQNAIDFWINFIKNKLDLKLSKITIHPDKKDWINLYSNYNENIVFDEECFWSDGVSEGYCTEFYVNYNGEDVEIGNIVNPNGDCIDVGFGLERLDMVTNNIVNSKEEILNRTICELLQAGFNPSNKLQGYVTRKLIRIYHKLFNISNFECNIYYDIILNEIKLYEKAKENYLKNKDKIKFRNKSKDWWFDTFGINIEDF